ncbi:MAG: Kelch repeat-containing protein [Actinomycetota bacterium]
MRNLASDPFGSGPTQASVIIHRKHLYRIVIVFASIASVLATTAPAQAYQSHWILENISGPTARYGAVEASVPWLGPGFNDWSNSALLFGGCADPNGSTTNPCSASKASSETWVYSFDSNTWTQQFPAHHPGARIGAAMMYDPGTGHVILFGGISGGEPGTLNSETWSWDGTDWTQLTPAHNPSARVWASFGTEAGSLSSRPVMFGGCIKVDSFNNCRDTSYPGNQTQQILAALQGDTWRWEVTAGVGDWVQYSPVTAPSARQAAAGSQTPQGYVAVFGGVGDLYVVGQGDTYNYLQDLWKWNGDTTTWTLVSATGGPSARAGSSAGPAQYNGIGSGTYLMITGGGNSATNLFAETWFFDENLTTWTKCGSSCQVPTAARALSAMAPDGDNVTELMFGGIKNDNASSYADTYRFPA